jgi:small subunit ribosomal protein S6
MLMNEYETTVILKPDLGGDDIEAALDRIRDVVSKEGGKLLNVEHWGRKRLAYDIQKYNRGIYVQAQYLGAGGLVAELERNIRISSAFLRFLTVKVEDEVTADSREVVEYVRPSYEAEDAEEEAVEAAAPEAPAEEASAEEASAEAPAADETAEEQA